MLLIHMYAVINCTNYINNCDLHGLGFHISVQLSNTVHMTNDTFNLFLRLQLAALHFNENSDHAQAVTKEGSRRNGIIFPKYKKGGYVVRKVLVNATYSKVIFLKVCAIFTCLLNRIC